jgi:uncharacterized protein (DUF927 family)
VIEYKRYENILHNHCRRACVQWNRRRNRDNRHPDNRNKNYQRGSIDFHHMSRDWEGEGEEQELMGVEQSHHPHQEAFQRTRTRKEEWKRVGDVLLFHLM